MSAVNTEMAAYPANRRSVAEPAQLQPENMHPRALPHSAKGMEEFDSTPAFKPNAADSWDTLYSVMQNYDKDMLNRRFSALNNLLVFAGLFSGVLTAFIAESYQWLQKDPADTTVDILRHISLQLESFSINPAFINSTTPSAPSAPSVSSTPSRLEIRVNVLWFMSLSMSLIAALFIILVQQWLQEYPVRIGVPSGRIGARIRQYRYLALLHWGVNDIIAFLPVLLQFALVLFLVGLLDLLWSLKPAIAIPATVFLGISLMLFLVTSISPLLWHHCPYKTPLAVVVFTAWQAVKVGVLSLSLFAVQGTMRRVQRLASLRRLSGWAWLFSVCEDRMRSLRNITWERLRASRALLASRTELTLRDIRAAKTQPETDLDAAMWGALAIPSNGIQQLEGCLDDFEPKERMMCVLTWAEGLLDFKLSHLYWVISYEPEKQFLQRNTFSIIDSAMAAKLRVLLLDHLSPVYEGGWISVHKRSSLVFLRQLVKIEPLPDHEFGRRYNKALVDALPRLTRGTELDSEAARILSRCVFECWTMRDPALDYQEIAALTSHIRNYENMTTLPLTGEEIDALAGLIAATLLLYSRRPSTAAPRAGLHSLVGTLMRLTDCPAETIVAICDRSLDANPAARSLSTPVWPSLCQSLLALARGDRSALPETLMQPLVDRLLRIFGSQADGRFREPMAPLRALQTIYRTSSHPMFPVALQDPQSADGGGDGQSEPVDKPLLEPPGGPVFGLGAPGDPDGQRLYGFGCDPDSRPRSSRTCIPADNPEPDLTVPDSGLS